MRGKKEKEGREEEIGKGLKKEEKLKEMKRGLLGLMLREGNMVVRMVERVREEVVEGKGMEDWVGRGRK